MKLFNDQTLPVVQKKALHSHDRVDLYERENQIKENKVSLSDRYEKDPRVKQYGTPSFDQRKIRQRIEHKKAKVLAEKVASEQKAAAKIENKRLQMLQEGKTPEEIQKATDQAVKKAENLATTGEQLKAALSVGSFKFSEKERVVLSEILK